MIKTAKQKAPKIATEAAIEEQSSDEGKRSIKAAKVSPTRAAVAGLAGKAVKKSAAEEVAATEVPVASAKRGAAPKAKAPAKAKAGNISKPVKEIVAGSVAVALVPSPRRKAPASTKAAAPMDSPVLFQIYYREDQKKDLDPDMVPYDNIGNRNPLLEFNVFSTLMKSGKLNDVPLWGALSWKFSEKSGITSRGLRNIIKANPGYDVYYCNAFPENEAVYHNLWIQGETAHPEFLDTARAFFKAARLPEEMLTELQPSTQFSTANYFVGTPRFWERYVAFVETALLLAAKHLPVALRERLLSSKADPRGVHFGASFLPFIVERLFPVFMATSGRGLKAFRYPLPVRHTENVHLQLLRQMKDVAVAKQDRWLAVCWVNYRNLYLDRLHGGEWMKKFAPAITPLAIQFPQSWA